MSAVRSSAVIGASRWLDANRLEGTSKNSATAKATISFSLFMAISSGSGIGGRRPSWIADRARRHARTVTTGYVYWPMYERNRRLDGSQFPIASRVVLTESRSMPNEWPSRFQGWVGFRGSLSKAGKCCYGSQQFL